MIGYTFMGMAHSNAWRNVASYFDVPASEQKVLVGRDVAGVAEAAAKYGWAETATDWRSVLDRDDIRVVDICAPGWLHAEITIAALEAGNGQLHNRKPATSRCCVTEKKLPDCLTFLTHLKRSGITAWIPRRRRRSLLAFEE